MQKERIIAKKVKNHREKLFDKWLGVNDRKLRNCITLTQDQKDKMFTAYGNGCSHAEVAMYIGLPQTSLLKFLSEHEVIKEEIELLRKKPTFKARINIVQAINDGSIDESKWYLERKEKEEFSPRSESKSLNVNVDIDMSKLTNEELDRVASGDFSGLGDIPKLK